MNVKIGVWATFAVGLMFLSTLAAPQNQPSFQDRRNQTINEMQNAIHEKVDSGEYRCCITPACDMCYLGHWIFEDGICRCDDMIAKGEYDKVCPQCKNKLDQICKSTT